MALQFTWTNFVLMRQGDLVERKVFYAIVLIAICQVIFIANWGVSWTAGGYLTTAGAIFSFFLHFFGFYALWNHNRLALLLYILVLFCLLFLYVADAVLAILSITLNSQVLAEGSQQISNVVPFQLQGIVGDDDTAMFLFVLLIIINVIVAILTFALFILVIQIRRLSNPQQKLAASPPRKTIEMRKTVVDYNIPGQFQRRKTGEFTNGLLSRPEDSKNQNLEQDLEDKQISV